GIPNPSSGPACPVQPFFDFVVDDPVNKETVKEVVGKGEETSQIYLDISGNLLFHVRQFCPESPQGSLEFLCHFLYLIQPVVFHNICQNTPSDQVNCTPSL